MKRALIAGLLVLSVWGPAMGRPDTPREVRQSNFSATLAVTDSQELAGRLSGLVQRHHGTIQSFNLDANNTNASASLQCPPQELDGLMADLVKLGKVENQSMSSSDYTQSYRDAAKRARIYEALSTVPLDRTLQSSSLSAEDQALAQAELQQMVRERIQSYQSSMQSYLDYNQRAQISLQFRLVGPDASRPTPNPEATPSDSPAPAQQPSTPFNQGVLLPLYLLGFVNLTFLWLMARRNAAAPPPGTRD